MSGQNHMPVAVHRVAKRRAGAYAATFVALLASYFFLRDMVWHTSVELLTSAEWAATILSLCVGALALVRFYSQKDITFLFIGTGYSVNGLLEGVHAVVTSSYFMDIFPSIPASRVAWSWYAPRLLLPVLLWLSWVFWKREQATREARRVSDNFVYWMVGILALAFFSLFDVAPLQGALQQNNLVARYKEFLPAIFLSLAVAGYYRKGKWKTDSFEHWLILAMIVGLMREAMLMPFSQKGYDSIFSVAQMLNIVSYLFAFIGLLVNMQRLFSESLAHRELVLKNIILSTQQETSQDAILIVDENATILSYNRRFVELWGLPEDMVRRLDDKPVLVHVVGKVADPERFLSRVKCLYEQRSEKSSDEIPLRDGRIIDRYSAPMVGPEGKYYGRIWYFRDVTAKKRSERMIRESEEKFRGLVDQSLVGIALIEGDKFSYVNHKFADIFGYGDAEILQMGPADMALDDDKSIVTEVLRKQLAGDMAGAEFTFRGRHKNGAVVDIEGRSALMHVSGKPVVIVIFLDITERILAENEVHLLQTQLREQAIRDPLTGLFNRRYLDEAIDRELARAERSGQPLSIVMGDIDNFKSINDTYGHLAGDEVLRVLGNQMKSNSRSSDIICRYGGEEFLLVLPDTDQENARDRAERLRAAFANAAIPYDAVSIHATVSFGVATFLGHGQSSGELIAVADRALYTAKKTGRNKVASFAA